MSASTFHAVGKVSINATAITCAEWKPDPGRPDAELLHVSVGLRSWDFPFCDEGVPELAAAVGLGDHAAELTKAAKAKEKAAEKAEAAATEAAEEAAKASAKEAAKVAKEAESAKPHTAAHGTHHASHK